MYNVRPYNADKDIEMITEWCKAYNEHAPIKEIIPASSYVLEIDNTPALFLSLIKTNTSICFFENFCGNPDFKGKRAEAVPYLINHIEQIAKAEGYLGIVTYAYKPKLVPLFETYGFTKACDLAALARRIA